MDLVNQEKSLLQREIERLTNLVLNQSATAATTADEDGSRRSPAIDDLDGGNTPQTPSCPQKADGLLDLFQLDLSEKRTSDGHVKVEIIHETPPKKKGEKKKKKSIASKRSGKKNSNSNSAQSFKEKLSLRKSLPMPFGRYGNNKSASANKEESNCCETK